MATTSIASLKTERSGIKAKLTRFATFLDAYDPNMHAQELQTRLNNVQSLLHSYEVNSSKIEALGTEEANANDHAEFENKYFKLVSTAQTLLIKKQSDIPRVTSTPIECNVKLPQINIPTFSGNYCNWLDFRDAFRSLIQENQQLNDVQRFYYLRSAIKGDAANVIKSLETTAENYKIAFDLLTQRYQNKKLIVHNHVKSIFDMPSLNKENYAGLRQLLDNTVKHLRSLKALGQPTESWDTLIIYILSNKMDPLTRRDWETCKYKNDIPIMEDLENFLKHKCDVLECIDSNKLDNRIQPQKLINKDQFRSNRQPYNAYAITAANNSCPYCKKDVHNIYRCNEFIALDVNARENAIKRLHLCINCFRSNHYAVNCKSSGCKICKMRHNSLLHRDHAPQVERENTELSVNHSAHCREGNKTQILLATAQIKVFDCNKEPHPCNVLLDNGSQCNLITENLCKKLGIYKTNINSSIRGINSTCSNISFKANVTIGSNYTDFQNCIQCLVVPKISGKLPTASFIVNRFNIPSELPLADPNFNEPKEIDMLLNSEIFWTILENKSMTLGENMPVLHATQLGWLVSGRIPINTSILNSFMVTLDGRKENAKPFWQSEGITNIKNQLTRDAQDCADVFQNSVIRDDNGRFIVNIPFKGSTELLGNSREVAIKRFQVLERRLSVNPNLKLQYTKFMEEYEQLGHMQDITNRNDKDGYFIPHFAVINNASLTTKLRVVFDASARTTSGISLNDIQYTGPKIQNDLFPLLIKFRTYDIVFTADVEKMFRQIQINPAQRKFQKILWRSNSFQPIKTFELNTLTYGMRSSPYVANKILHILSDEYKDVYPNASEILMNSFYMDDLISGTDDVDSAISIINQVNSILSSACIKLRKWQSNSTQLLKSLEGNVELIKEFGDNSVSKLLGIVWNSNTDTIKYNITDTYKEAHLTKRYILTHIARIFDPLGLVSPTIVIAKLIMQQLWQQKLGWDETIPNNIKDVWNKLAEQLQLLNQINLPRKISINSIKNAELHGFCDASIKAYGACIYVKSIDTSGNCHVELFCAKSRIATLKQTTLPRLELNGALLLSELMKQVIELLQIPGNKTYYWCDSTIVLSWIKSRPERLKQYISNRTARIQNLSSQERWFYVCSRDNLADIVSRGSYPKDLINNKLWFHGGTWLSKTEINYPIQHVELVTDAGTQDDEYDTQCYINTINGEFIFNRFSSLVKLQNVIAYCLRFTHNSRSNMGQRRVGYLTVDEINNSLTILIRIAQQQYYHGEIQNLSKQLPLNSKSALISLDPMLDKENILRVGGRLRNSRFNMDKKHPIILPPHCKLTELIIKQEHERLLHCGPQALISSIRERYWPIRGKNSVRKICRSCTICFRINPKLINHPLMGQLPADRLNNTPPFFITGVDYAGPILIKDRILRNAKLIKAYMVLFVCFSTKAIHLDVVTSLTSVAFIDVLKRFVARRGRPNTIYSDNGTNFIGAQKELNEFLNDKSQLNSVNTHCLSEQIKWKFIPANSPNFGGLWESGIKSAKAHLYKILKNAQVNYEQLSTILCEVEAVLNSRPISSLSNSPDDLLPLTPGHFLIGRPITSIAEYNYLNINENRLNKFQRLQKIKQHFWQRWSKEYIGELQTRAKWKQRAEELVQTGVLVLVKDDNLPPLKWKLGRIIEIFPGQDGIVRVAAVKTDTSIIKRAISKLCVLPCNEQ